MYVEREKIGEQNEQIWLQMGFRCGQQAETY